MRRGTRGALPLSQPDGEKKSEEGREKARGGGEGVAEELERLRVCVRAK